MRAHDTSELSYYSFCTAYAIKSSAMIGANEKGYGQFCPVAMAADIFCARWTPLILREMLCGSTRFNDIRRGLPRISPTLLSRRLKELEKAGLVEERKSPKKRGTTDYQLTTAGEDLREVVISLGLWGHRWIEIFSVAEKSRPIAADVGHAATLGGVSCSKRALYGEIRLSGAQRAENMVGRH